MQKINDDETIVLANAYVDIIDLAQELETKQGVGRPLIIDALLSAAVNLSADGEAFVAAVEAIKRRHRIEKC